MIDEALASNKTPVSDATSENVAKDATLLPK
jgi:hypothetical protein